MKKPRIEMEGDIPLDFIEDMRCRFGSENVEVIDDSQSLLVRELTEFKKPLTPGERLKTLREMKGMTQKELAKLVHSRDTNISLLESGKRVISEEKAEAFAQVFEGVSPRFFLTKKD